VGRKTVRPVHDVVVIPGEVTALGVLHLDDALAEICEHACAHRRGHGLLQRDDGDSGQRRVRCVTDGGRRVRVHHLDIASKA
jgi:hypothetical protein